MLLGFGEQVEVTIQLFNRNEAPIEDATIAFDLVGRPQDASLSELSVTTDSQGKASVTLFAGQRAATFGLRASALGALPVTFNAAVGGAGFGTLLVRAPYDGDRVVAERHVLAYPGLDCDEVTRVRTDRSTVIAPDDEAASLIALPAELDYAVLVVGEGATDAVLTKGCMDGVIVQADSVFEIEVPFDDAALIPANDLELSAQLEAREVAATLAVAIRRAGERVVRSDALGQNAPIDAEGRFWLDSLGLALRDSGATSAQAQLADALAAARAAALEMPATGSPEAELAVLLEINGEGAQLATSEISTHVRAALATLELHARLTIESSDALAVRFAPESFSCLPIKEGASAASVDLSDQEPVEVNARSQPRVDAIDLRALSFSPRFGALTIDVLEQLVVPTDAGFGEQLMALSGCGSLAEWLGQQTFVDASACDEACIAAACDISMARLLDAAKEDLQAIDAARPVLSLSGVLDLADADGDLIAESMMSDALAGEWQPEADASLADTLLGVARAVLSPAASDP